MKPSLVYQIAIGDIPDKAQNILSLNRDWCYENNVRYVLDTFRPCMSPICYQSDLQRFLKACSTDNMIYADWDCELHGEIDLPENRPMFGRDHRGRRDIFLFWTGKTYPFFARMMLQWQSLRMSPMSGYPLCKHFEKEIDDFPTNFYTHRRFESGRGPWQP